MSKIIVEVKMTTRIIKKRRFRYKIKIKWVCKSKVKNTKMLKRIAAWILMMTNSQTRNFGPMKERKAGPLVEIKIKMIFLSMDILTNHLSLTYLKTWPKSPLKKV